MINILDSYYATVNRTYLYEKILFIIIISFGRFNNGKTFCNFSGRNCSHYRKKSSWRRQNEYSPQYNCWSDCCIHSFLYFVNCQQTLC